MIRKLINRETAVYLLCGALTTALALGSFWLCARVGLSTVTANTLSTILAVLFAYAGNKIFVFRSGSWAAATVLREAVSFFAGRAVMYALETGLLVWLIDRQGWPDALCKGGTTALVILCNYIVSKRLVFRR